MATPNKIAVLGGGSFGTAIANMIAANGHDVVLWMRDEENAKQCSQTRENTRYLPGYHLEPTLKFSSSLEECLKGRHTIFFSVPSKAFRHLAQEAHAHIAPDTKVISTAKGIEAHTFKLMSEILEEELPQA
ncbi:MAG: NAD(P)-binding domain-containing protein, partial [Porticoccus sp.]